MWMKGEKNLKAEGRALDTIAYHNCLNTFLCHQLGKFWCLWYKVCVKSVLLIFWNARETWHFLSFLVVFTTGIRIRSSITPRNLLFWVTGDVCSKSGFLYYLTGRVSYLRTPNIVNHIYVWESSKIISVPGKFKEWSQNPRSKVKKKKSRKWNLTGALPYLCYISNVDLIISGNKVSFRIILSCNFLINATQFQNFHSGLSLPILLLASP